MTGIAESNDEAWTIGRVLLWASQDFKKRGIDSARLDAELLLGRVLATDRVRLIVDSQRLLHPDELRAYRDLIKRRRNGEPVAYILGQREFYGLPFRVDTRVLIPRPDTETLVDVALDRTRSRSMYGKALDLCTGSGCVALAFKKQRRTWRVTASDASPDAVAVARDNAARLGLTWGTHFTTGDLFGPFAADERFDLITANPPYIPGPEIATLDVGIREYEPRLALEGGADGLSLVRRIIADARSHLAPGAVIALEIGHDQSDRVAALFEEAGYASIDRRRDYGGHERVVSARYDKPQR
jgi:release factor glutamine methyltransferase